MMRHAITALLSVSLAVPLVAQKSGPVLKTSKADTASSISSPAPASNAKPVTAPIVVHDKHGAPVPDLTQDQLQLLVDKKPADIRSFSRDTSSPLTLGLLVDIGPTQRQGINDERKATQAFLESTLSTADKAFIVQFSRQTDLLQDATDSRALIQAGLQQLGTASPNSTDDSHDDSATDQNTPSNGGGNNPGRNGPYGRGGRGGNVPTIGAVRRPNSVLYDSLFLSANEVTAKQTGRKVLVLLTDGHDHGSKESLGSAIEAAQRADTIVYAIYVKGQPEKSDRSNHGFSIGDPNQCDPYGPPGGYPGSYPPYGYPDCTPPTQTGSVESSDGRKILARIADQTGGHLFELDKKNTLADIYKQIADDLHAQYRLSFTPDKDASADGYHRIEVSLKGDPKDLSVQTRDGYYEGDPD